MVYELVIDDEKIDEVFAISLVAEPAIESNFVYFNKDEVKFSAVDNEKRLVMGPLLIPNKQILRVDGGGRPYTVFFRPETIKRLSEKYLEKKYTDKATLEHNKPIDDVVLVESWIVESREKDKSKLYNINVPAGTWMGTMKINNEEVWNDYVKTGKVKGFSIEGVFGHDLVAASRLNLSKDISLLDDYEAEVVLNKIRAMFESYSDYGQEIRNNAKRGIELNERNGNKCATQTGKVRAQQIANGEKLSVETIKRMYSYLSRAETYYDENDTTSCGTISYLLWGGKSALSWSRNKLRELGLLQENEAQPSIPNSSYPGEAISGSIAPALLQVESPNIDVLGYETKNFEICPGAISLFEHLTDMVSSKSDDELFGMIRSAAVVADSIFRIEKEVISAGKATASQLDGVRILVKDFRDIMKEIDEDLGMKHDTSFMDGHIKIIESYL
jgi:hypothetical protein